MTDELHLVTMTTNVGDQHDSSSWHDHHQCQPVWRQQQPPQLHLLGDQACQISYIVLHKSQGPWGAVKPLDQALISSVIASLLRYISFIHYMEHCCLISCTNSIALSSGSRVGSHPFGKISAQFEITQLSIVGVFGTLFGGPKKKSGHSVLLKDLFEYGHSTGWSC